MASSSNTKSSNINSEGTTSNIKNDIKESMNSTSKNNDSNDDHARVLVAYNGKWRWDGEKWLFENSEGSIMAVSKYVTLSQITTDLYRILDVDQSSYRLKLEVHYRGGSPWFPPTEIQNDQDLSVFISESWKTKLPLCVTRVANIVPLEVHWRTDHVRVLVAYNGKWRWDGEKWLFENSEGLIMDVYKYVTLSQITNILYAGLNVDQSSYRLKLEVHYRGGSPWFPIIEIKDDQNLLVFISEYWKTNLPLCVTRVAKVVVVEEHGRKDDRVEKRLLKAIRKNDWVKARQIVNTGEVTWTSKLDENGFTALHFAVGEYKDNEVVRDIVMGIDNELLVTTLNNRGRTPAHLAAILGNTEALKMMLDSEPKCLFIPDKDGFLPIHTALYIPALNTFLYLFKQMKSNKDDYDILFSGMHGPYLLHRAIDTGVIDVAYELINNYPSLATTVYENKTAVKCIIRKPELFYSGMHNYNFYSRFVYNIVPIENNSLGGTNTPDVENQMTPKKRSLHDVPHVMHLRDDKVKHSTTLKLLRRICKEADRTHTLSDIERLFTSPFFLAVENNTTEAVDALTTYSKELYNCKKDGLNVCELIVLNRSEKVYSSIKDQHIKDQRTTYFKYGFQLVKDDDGNNILHLAARLAPMHKLNAASGAALQMQRELQWFEELKRLVGITHTRALNKNKETPMMVFRIAHKELRKDGEEWMKKTADSYTITAALIITIVFAAAITVPGGNDGTTGKPIYETKASLIIFAISDAISLFTSTTSLLLFLSILTARYADEDFLYKLPKRLIYGLVMLFVSVTSMMIAFSAALYIMFGQEKEWILIPIAALACLPIASFVTLQFPLRVELISSTYGHGIFGKEKDYRQSSANANKKKRA